MGGGQPLRQPGADGIWCPRPEAWARSLGVAGAGSSPSSLPKGKVHSWDSFLAGDLVGRLKIAASPTSPSLPLRSPQEAGVGGHRLGEFQ